MLLTVSLSGVVKKHVDGCSAVKMAKNQCFSDMCTVGLCAKAPRLRKLPFWNSHMGAGCTPVE